MAITAQCKLDRAFGHGGIASFSPAASWGSNYYFASLAVGASGDLFVAGIAKAGWIVGKLGPDGAPVAGFGRNGFVTYADPGPLRSAGSNGGATDVVPVSSGGAYVIGYDGQGHCCVSGSVVELGASGAIVRSFGKNGSAGPLGNGSLASLLSRLPHGRLLVVTSYEYTGCGSYNLAELDSDGRGIAGFSGHVLAKARGDRMVIVDLAANGGFDLVTRDWLCRGYHHLPPPTATVVGYLADGSVVTGFGHGGTSTVPGTPFGALDGPGGVIAVAVADNSHCAVRLLSSDRTLKRSSACGSGGAWDPAAPETVVATPFGASATASTAVVIGAAAHGLSIGRYSL